MAHVERILIVGGGIAGLTLATALHQHGLLAELVERSNVWQAVGAGIAVQPNGIRILHTLGMGKAVEHVGAGIHYWDMCDQQGEVLCETDLQGLWRDVGPFIGIARGKLQHVLAEILCAAESVEHALDTYVSRRRPRVGWVQQQSRVVAESFGLPPAVRNTVLRERGDQLMYARFSPLIPAP